MSTPGQNNKLLYVARQLVADCKVGLLTTCNNIGHAHASYMNVLVDSTMSEVVAISAPGTEKTENLIQNPHAEWMFASSSLESLVYLSGTTEIMTGERARRYWDAMPNKSKAPYRNYSDSDDPEDFAIIRTKVAKATYCRPPGYQKTLICEL